MSVLVTGGAGFIGSHIVLALLDAGETVVAFDGLRADTLAAVPAGAAFVQGEIADRALLRDTLRDYGVTAIIHAAAPPLPGDAPHTIAQVFSDGLAAGITLFEDALAADVRHIVMTSTADVYATSAAPVTEDAAKQPQFAAANAQLMLETILRRITARGTMNHAILRVSDVTGADPRGRIGPMRVASADFVDRACRGAVSDAGSLEWPEAEAAAVPRDLVHVSDVAQAHVLALHRLRDNADCLVLNCGSGRGTSAADVLAAVRAATGKKLKTAPPARTGGKRRPLVLDLTGITQTLGWSPRLSDLDTLVKTTLDWARAPAQPDETDAPDLDWIDLEAVEEQLTRRRDVASGPWLHLLAARNAADDPGHAHFKRIAGKLRRRMRDRHEVMVKIAAAAIDRRELDFARETLELVPFELQGRPDVRVQAARHAFESGNFNRALQLTEHLTATPSPQAFGLRLVTLGQLKRFREAFDLVSDELTELRSIDWAVLRLFSDYGEARLELPEFYEALETAAEAYPNQYQSAKIRLLTRARQYNLAIELCQNLISECRTSAEAATAVAEAYLRSGAWPKGRAALSAALTMLPPDSDLGIEAQAKLEALDDLDAFYQQAPHSIPRDFAVPASFLEYFYLKPGDDDAPGADAPGNGVVHVASTLDSGPEYRALLNAHRWARNGAAPDSEIWLLSRDGAHLHDQPLVMADAGGNPLGGIRTLPQPGSVPKAFTRLPTAFALDVARLHEAIAARRPRVLHGWQDAANLEVGLAGLTAGVERIVLHTQNLRPHIALPELSGTTIKRGYRALLSRPEVDLVCCSRAVLSTYLGFLGLPESDRFHVVHDGFDWRTAPALESRAADRARLRKKFGIPDDAIVIGGALPLIDESRPELWIETAIRAAGHDSRLHFLLAGSGPALPDIRKRARAYGLDGRMTFVENLREGVVLGPVLDLLLHTARFDALPGALIGALGNAVPVVASSYGGAFECIPPGSQIRALTLVPGDAPEDFLEAMLASLKDRLPDDAMLDVARDVRAYFSVDRMTRELGQIYDRHTERQG